MQDKSIYKEHYLGETYRAGIAYLRARSHKDDRAPRRIGTYSLDTQRQIIAKAARAQKTIIVAEFIEYGDHARGLRPAFTAAVALASETCVPVLFTARAEYLTWRRDDFTFLARYLATSEIALVPAYDRRKQR